MKKTLSELSGLIFKRSDKVILSDLSLDIKMLNIAWAMDGSRDLGTVARQDGYEVHALAEQVEKLIQLGALEVEPGAINTVSNKLIDELVRDLSRSVGPVAGIIVEDTVNEMGYSFSTLPVTQFKQLLDRLAMEIHDADSIAVFVKRMAGKTA